MAAPVERVDAPKHDEVEAFTNSTACARAWLRGEYAYLTAAHVRPQGSQSVLRLAGHNPANAFVVDHVFAPAFRVLEKMTHGRLTVQPLWSGASHRLTEGWQALRERRVEMTACYPNLDADGLGFALVQGLYLPGLFPNPAVGTLASELLYERYLRPEYERHGVRMGRLKATESDVIFSIRPIRRLEDMEGLRVSAGRGWQGRVFEALGARVVPVPSDGLRDALEKGEIDAACMTDGSCKVFGVSDLVRYRLDAGLGRLNLEYCLAPDAFDELPPDLQAAFEIWLRGLSQAEAQVFYGLGGAMARSAFAKQGMHFTILDAAERGRWQAAIAGVRLDFVADLEARGLPARQFLQDALDIAATYGGAPESHLMQRAIFSPVTGISASGSRRLLKEIS